MRVPIKEDEWAAKGLTVERVVERESLKFTLRGRSDPISAIIQGDEIELFPERSSDHVALIAELGLDATPVKAK